MTFAAAGSGFGFGFGFGLARLPRCAAWFETTSGSVPLRDASVERDRGERDPVPAVGTRVRVPAQRERRGAVAADHVAVDVEADPGRLRAAHVRADPQQCP